MTGSPAPDHWLDRLATASLTRRTALKAGLAAAAALALPLSRGPRASADIITQPCFTGCRWFEHKQFLAARQACVSTDHLATGGVLGYTLGLVPLILPGLTIASFAEAAVGNRVYHQCLDSAIIDAKVAAFDCYDSNACKGFDPKQAGGPCDGCLQNCCVCENIPTGYICCFYSCDDETHDCCPT